MRQEAVILEMIDISKSFGGAKALVDVRFELKKGEVHALIGENGAGKSTLMKILLAMIKQDSGQIIYKGNLVNFKSPTEALKSGISMIHQEISLVPTMDVAENIWLGRENLFKVSGLIRAKKRYASTNELLNKLGIRIDPRTLVKNLSIANMQLVELARAVSYNSEIIIMDEPTSALTEAEIQLLYKIVRELSSEGVSIIFISHKLEEIYKICDRITVLRDGKYIGTEYCADLKQEELIKMIVGRELNDLFPKQNTTIGSKILEVIGLCREGYFSDISFEVHKGEILGFAGLMGAGRTEIMETIFGLSKPDSGSIFVDGKKVDIKSPEDAISMGIAMVTEDRLRQGAIHELPVFMNMSLANLKNISKLKFINSRIEKNECIDMVDKLSIILAAISQLMKSLSGGNQQKVIIGRWLMTNPRILILDEPTRGIDVGSKSEIHRLISTLAQQGVAIIIVSSELPEILGMCDRIIVIRDGRIALESSRDEVTQESIMSYAFGK